MAPPEFELDAMVAYRGKPMRVAGRLRLEGVSGQVSRRYLFADDSGAPVVVEEAEGRYSLLRPFPPAARPPTKGNTITVGVERYTLVGVRRLKVLESLGLVPGSTGKAELLVSGMYEGLMGTLMREIVLGTDRQVIYLVRPLHEGDLLSEAEHAARRAAERQAAGARDGD
jgi:hypothetical protein